MLKVIVCVEANVFIILHNDFEKYQMQLVRVDENTME